MVAAFSSLFLIGLCVWAVRQEIARLTALNPGADARTLMRQTDIPLFCAVCFAIFVAFIAPVVSLVRVRKTTRGYNKPIRSKSAAHGDAECATMKLARELFPEDGALVLGELYRPDLDPKSTSRVFKPGDRKTWGSGGHVLVEIVGQVVEHRRLLGGSGTASIAAFMATQGRARGPDAPARGSASHAGDAAARAEAERRTALQPSILLRDAKPLSGGGGKSSD